MKACGFDVLLTEAVTGREMIAVNVIHFILYIYFRILDNALGDFFIGPTPFDITLAIKETQ